MATRWIHSGPAAGVVIAVGPTWRDVYVVRPRVLGDVRFDVAPGLDGQYCGSVGGMAVMNGTTRGSSVECRAGQSLSVMAASMTSSALQQKQIVDLNEFRRGVGLCVFNKEGLVFAARRTDDTAQTWQMPQGGIDARENPLVAGVRELEEETGIRNVRVVASIDSWLDYEFPTKVKHASGRHWLRYKGQTQKWLLMEFTGHDDEIDLFAAHGMESNGAFSVEFSEWRWMPLEDLATSVVDFKKGVYTRVLQHFGPRIQSHIGQHRIAGL